MALKLLVDIGNSRMKWRLTEGSDTTGAAGMIAGPITPAAVSHTWERQQDMPPVQIAVSNVRGSETEAVLTDWCQTRWQQSPWFVRSTDPVIGIKNSYKDPAQLGSDRLLALLGARTLSPGTLAVVDCGTALTIDLLDADDCFRGGVILPGPQLAANALRERAPGIAAAGTDSAVPESVLGRSTQECIDSGVYFGTGGAIDRLLEELLSPLGAAGDTPVYFTGGDAEDLRKFVKHTVTQVPDLVLRGLLEVLRRKC